MSISKYEIAHYMLKVLRQQPAQTMAAKSLAAAVSSVAGEQISLGRLRHALSAAAGLVYQDMDGDFHLYPKNAPRPHANAGLHTAKRLMDQRKYDHARQVLVRSMEKGDVNAENLSALAQCYKMMGAVSKAFAILKRRIHDFPEDEESLAILASLAEENHDYVTAVQALQRLETIGATSSREKERLAEMLFRSGQFLLALESLGQLPTAARTRTRTLLLKASCEERLRDWASATKTYSAVLRKDKKNKRAKAGLAYVKSRRTAPSPR